MDKVDRVLVVEVKVDRGLVVEVDRDLVEEVDRVVVDKVYAD